METEPTPSNVVGDLCRKQLQAHAAPFQSLPHLFRASRWEIERYWRLNKSGATTTFDLPTYHMEDLVTLIVPYRAQQKKMRSPIGYAEWDAGESILQTV